MSKINKNIEGYEMVANVTKACGCERTAQTHLFICKRGSKCGMGTEGLDGIVAVCKNTRENYERFRTMCPYSDPNYILWWGTIVYSLDDDGEDFIEFHWG